MFEHDCTDSQCECKEFVKGYLVFKCGKVFSLIRKPKQLHGHVRKSGYARVKIQVGEKKVLKFVHVIVCEAFHGPRPDGMQCCHKDGNPANNNSDNLKWGSKLENTRDMVLHGGVKWGESCWLAKLTWQDVNQIRADYTGRPGECGKIAAKYGVSTSTVSSVVNRKTWNPDNTKRKYGV